MSLPEGGKMLRNAKQGVKVYEVQISLKVHPCVDKKADRQKDTQRERLDTADNHKELDT